MEYRQQNDEGMKVIGYDLYAIGYSKYGDPTNSGVDYVTNFEQQIGERVTDAEKLEGLVQLAMSTTQEQLKELYRKQILQYDVTSIKLQIEEITDDDDCIMGEPVYERDVEITDMPRLVEINWDDLTNEKKQELIKRFGENHFWKLTPLVSMEVDNEWPKITPENVKPDILYRDLLRKYTDGCTRGCCIHWDPNTQRWSLSVLPTDDAATKITTAIENDGFEQLTQVVTETDLVFAYNKHFNGFRVVAVLTSESPDHLELQIGYDPEDEEAGYLDEVCHCPYGGDEHDDCADCAYAGDYHYDPDSGECVERVWEVKDEKK